MFSHDETPSTFRILIIEDNQSAVEILKSVFHQHQKKIDIAFDGEQALPFLQHYEYDLIVMDWNMPRLSGRDTLIEIDQLLAKMKQKKSLPKTLPVILSTGNSLESLELPVCRNLSYIGYLDKSQPMAKLQQMCSKIFMHYRPPMAS